MTDGEVDLGLSQSNVTRAAESTRMAVNGPMSHLNCNTSNTSVARCVWQLSDTSRVRKARRFSWSSSKDAGHGTRGLVSDFP